MLKKFDLISAIKFYGILSDVTGRDYLNSLDAALRGGVSMIQLRLKHVSDTEYISCALDVKKLCDKYEVPLIINDNVYAAAKAEAAGVHLGQGDMTVSDARKYLGTDSIIGATAHNSDEAVTACGMGADYLGVGAAFPTSSKSDARQLSSHRLYKEITEAAGIPVVAIGGINETNICELKNLGLSGFAMIGAIFSCNDIYKQCLRLGELCKKYSVSE